MAASDIVIQGAREHNLRNVHVVLPRNRLICLTGVSGSGKSSLAFDTLYAEGQRRYIESLSTFARQFIGQMPKPNVDRIEGLSPSICISQKTAGSNPRSTVGTITEIYDFLRVLYARVGTCYCPNCGEVIRAQSRQEIVAQILETMAGKAVLILAPIVRGKKGEHRDLLAALLRRGYARARIDGQVVRLEQDLRLRRPVRHDIELVVDRLTVSPSSRSRVAEAVEGALHLSNGDVMVVLAEESEGQEKEKSRRQQPVWHFSSRYACKRCQIGFPPPSPQLFSFNSTEGMCPRCGGLGQVFKQDISLLFGDRSRSIQQGLIQGLGKWEDLPKWPQQSLREMARRLERAMGLEKGTVLETAWEDLPPEVQEVLLNGVESPQISADVRSRIYGELGVFPGLIRELERVGFVREEQRELLESIRREMPCPDCGGARLTKRARFVRIRTTHPEFAAACEKSLPEVCDLPIAQARLFFSGLELDATAHKIAGEPLKEIRNRLDFLMNVGLDYLTLGRAAPSLSGGEMQRIRLAGQIGAGLVGVTYILDEPSIGLHPRDNDRLLGTLAQLRDQGNTVVVVEHDEDTMRAADYIVDFGPGPGARGGQIVAAGDAEELARNSASLTGQYLSGQRFIPVPAKRRKPTKKKLVVRGARHNNLKNVDVEIPLGLFVCVTGVSGSGKSSLVNDILVEALNRHLNHGNGQPGAYDRIEGLQHLDKMISIDQSPIGRTPRSNPATYIKLFDEIRKLFAELPESKLRGYRPGRFSFNVSGGRCEACEGHGATKLEMDFLADIWVTCPVCEGRRFNRQTLQIQYKGKSIADVLEMEVRDALELFQNIPAIRRKLETLHAVGLDYMQLGQPSPTLSGGEAQRVKLARELVKRSTGRTIYFLDEPTTGLHFADVELLLRVLHNFVEAGNTVVVVEHNLEVIKTADWVIDLGPEGGEQGGFIVAAGPPEQVAEVQASHTGRFLRTVLAGQTLPASNGDGKEREKFFQNLKARTKQVQPISFVSVKGAQEHNLKGVDAKIPRDKLTVFCGRSGSGKSSLAMDTIYAEGQRRYVESLSTYARQFVSQMQKPKVDRVEGLSPAIAIEQKHAANTPRSTVGTVTEIYDYLRVLMARLGQPYCPECNLPVGTQTLDQIVDKIMDHPAGKPLLLLAPLDLRDGGDVEELWEQLRRSGYSRVRVDGVIHKLDSPPPIDHRRKHQVEVVVDRIILRHDQRSRVAGSVENALTLGEGVVIVAYPDERIPEPMWKTAVHSQHFACQRCGRSFEPLAPHHFSFNSPLGWCPGCQGLGVETGADPAVLILDPNQTLLEQALVIWPNTKDALGRAMVEAFCRDTGIPTDVPFCELSANARRLILHGTGERWFVVSQEDYQKHRGEGNQAADEEPASAAGPRVLLRFQYKGLYPALEAAANSVPQLRAALGSVVAETECTLCGGSRLRDDASAARFRGRTIDEWCRLSLGRLLREVQQWKLDEREQQIAGEIVREIQTRVQFLVDVGLQYLSLGRPAPTLSGGESQRIRLAAQVGSGLCGVLYVLDEPTIGLHPRDNRRLLDALQKLRDLGNTLLVVEHDREVIGAADYLLDFGPEAGAKGGEIVAEGPPKLVAECERSVTGAYLCGKKAIAVPTPRRMPRWFTDHAAQHVATLPIDVRRSPGWDLWSKLATPGGGWLEVLGARHNNLKNIDVSIPLGTLTVITGVSGSGKSSLVEDIIYPALARSFHRAQVTPGAHDRLRGLKAINKVIRVDQQPLGQTPTSTPATYTGMFDLIRDLFAVLPEAKRRGFTRRRFSFNVPGGRCEKCEGAGQVKIEMHFLPDVWVECEACHGKRYDAETLAVTYHDKSISDVLNMSCQEALNLFRDIPALARILQILCDVGLGYLQLGQPANTLSGGEAQRVKLAAELARPDTGRTVYLLDEPTTGLHFDDLQKLLDVLDRLVDLGNTVIVIEHNLDVVKSADWIIDLGPDAGDQGGFIVAVGTPEDIVDYSRWWQKTYGKATKTYGKATNADAASEAARVTAADTPPWRCYTGEVLEPVLRAGPFRERSSFRRPEGAPTVRGKSQPALRIGSESALSSESASALSSDAALAMPSGTEGTADDTVRPPWETNGRTWHLERQFGINGKPRRWEPEILLEVLNIIERHGGFAQPEWNSPNVVVVRGAKKSRGWFLRAYTGDDAQLRLVFRATPRALRGVRSATLLTPRKDDRKRTTAPVSLFGERKNNANGKTVLPSPTAELRRENYWSELEIRVSKKDDLHWRVFRQIIEEAMEGFLELGSPASEKPNYNFTWHTSAADFPEPARWPPNLVIPIVKAILNSVPDWTCDYRHASAIFVREAKTGRTCAKIFTKNPSALRIVFRTAKGTFDRKKLPSLGGQWRLDTAWPHEDRLILRLTTLDGFDLDGFRTLLKRVVTSLPTYRLTAEG